MTDDERLAIATRATYAAVLQYAANEQGVSAVVALRISAGLLGHSLVMANVTQAQLIGYSPGVPFIHQAVSESLQSTIGNLLQIAASEGLNPDPNSGWKAELPANLDLSTEETLVMVGPLTRHFKKLLEANGLSWSHATLLLVFVVCRLIREVIPNVSEPIAKSIVMKSLYSCAKSIPLSL